MIKNINFVHSNRFNIKLNMNDLNKDINLKYDNLLAQFKTLQKEHELCHQKLNNILKINKSIEYLNELVINGIDFIDLKKEIYNIIQQVFNTHHSDLYLISSDKKYLFLERENIKKENIDKFEKILSIKIPEIVKISLDIDNWYSITIKSKQPQICNTNSDLESIILAYIESNFPKLPLKKTISQITAFIKHPFYIISFPIFFNNNAIGLLDLNFIKKPNQEDLKLIHFFISEIAIYIYYFNTIQFLNRITNKISDVVWLMDLKGNSLYVTDSISSFTGYTKEEYLKQTIHERFTPKSAKIAFDTLNNELNNNKDINNIPQNYTKSLILEYVCKNGQIKTGEVIITPYFNNKECVGILGVTRDITYKIEAEKKYQDIFENIQDIIYKTDLNGSILEINPYVEKISGFKRKDLIGKPVSELYWNVDDRIHLINEILKTGKITNYEIKLRSSNNEIIYALASSRLIYDQNNTPQYIEGVLHNITDFVLANKKIQDLSIVIENSQNEIYIFDCETLKFYYANKAALNNLQYSEEEITKLTPLDIKPDISPHEFYKHLDILLSGKAEITYFETTHLRKDNTKYFVSVNLQLSTYNEKKVFNAIIIDITDKKNTEEKLIFNNLVLAKLNDLSFQLINDNKGDKIESTIVKALKDITQAKMVTFNEFDPIKQELKLKAIETNPGVFEKIINLLGKSSKDIAIPISKEIYDKITNEQIGYLKTISEATFGSIPHSIGFIIDTLLQTKQYIALVFLLEGRLYGTSLIALKQDVNMLTNEMLKNIINIISASLKQINYQNKIIETKEIAEAKEKIVRLQKEEIKLQNERLESLLRIAKQNTNNIQELLDYSLNEAIKLTHSKIGFLYFYDEQKQEFILNSWSKEVMNECKVLNPQTVYKLVDTGLWGEVVRQRKPILVNNYHAKNPFKKGTPQGHVQLNKFLSIPVFIQNKIVATIGVANKETDYNEADILQLTLLMDNVWKITERITLIENLKIAKEKAEESDRLKSAFLANVSHEIRTPMNAILGFAEILKNHKLSEEDQQKYYQIIEQSGQRMLNIINDIIDISKIEAGLVSTNIIDVDLNEQFNYIYNFFKPEAEQKGLLFDVNSCCLKNTFIKTDKEKFIAILSNLIKNSIKYTEHGFIQLSCKQIDNFIEFKIKDTGIGIPKDRQDAVFERFIQADITDKNAKQGAGLGLSIAKAYVELLGGNIWLESEEQKGTTFYFTIPCNNIDNYYSNNLSSNNTAEKSKNKKINILIVEDDENSMLLLNIILKNYGKIIYKATNGLDALNIIEKHPEIDLILMDIGLPNMNGLEVVEKIRQFNNKVIIIAQTAYGFLSDKENALKSGCNDYISKPIKKDNIIALINKYF